MPMPNDSTAHLVARNHRTPVPTPRKNVAFPARSLQDQLWTLTPRPGSRHLCSTFPSRFVCKSQVLGIAWAWGCKQGHQKEKVSMGWFLVFAFVSMKHRLFPMLISDRAVADKQDMAEKQPVTSVEVSFPDMNLRKPLLSLLS